jgi:hypothetical protein
MFFNAYLICLRSTRGSTIKRTIHVGRSYKSVRGRRPEWKYTFSIDDKGGDIYQIQRTEAWFQGEPWSQRCRHGSRGRMSDMISIIHQSVSINAKGGDCLLFGLVVIDVNPEEISIANSSNTKVWVMEPILVDV